MLLLSENRKYRLTLHEHFCLGECWLELHHKPSGNVQVEKRGLSELQRLKQVYSAIDLDTCARLFTGDKVQIYKPLLDRDQ